MQVTLSMLEAGDLFYILENGKRSQPMMLLADNPFDRFANHSYVCNLKTGEVRLLDKFSTKVIPYDAYELYFRSPDDGSMLLLRSRAATVEG